MKMEKKQKTKTRGMLLKEGKWIKKANSDENINRYWMEACERTVLTSDSEEEFEQLTEYLAQCSSEKGKKVSIDNEKNNKWS